MHRYVSLHNHDVFSIKDALYFPNDYLKIVKEKGMKAYSQNNHGSMAGCFDFYDSAKEHGIKPILGGEFYFVEDKLIKDKATESRDHIILQAKNKKGYEKLLKLQYTSSMTGFYYKPRIDWEDIKELGNDIICSSACSGGIIAKHLKDDPILLEERILKFKEIFKDDFYFEYVALSRVNYYGPIWQRMFELSQKHRIKNIITCDTHYIHKEDWKYQEILHNIANKTTLEEMKIKKETGKGKGWIMEDKDLYLKSYEEIMDIMRPVFSDKLNAEFLDNTLEIADKIESYEIYPKGYVYPKLNINEEDMKNKIKENLKKKVKLTDENIKIYQDRIKYEWGVIKKMGFVEYFAIVADIIGWAKKNDIPCGPGRGSGAGSIISYLLDITDVDAVKNNLSFVRFMSTERVKMPDIDSDISKNKRQQVLSYIKKYGEENVTQISSYGTFKVKNTFKDVARIYGVSTEEANLVTKNMEDDDNNNTVMPTTEDILNILYPQKEIRENEENKTKIKELKHKYDKILDATKHLKGMIRQFGTHAGGVIITDKPIYEYFPVIHSEEGVMSAIDGDTLSSKGFLKIDLLGLLALDIIDDTINLIRKNENININLNDIDLEDKKVMELFREADTENIFQFNTHAMKGGNYVTATGYKGYKKGLLERTQPDKFEHLVQLNALNRPGPLKIKMDDRYEERKVLKEKYKTPKLLEPHLKDTYGLLLYQEQVINILADWLDINLGIADIMRKKMEKHSIKELLNNGNYFEHLYNKYDKKDLEEALDFLQESAGYSFNKSHSWSYSLLAFQMAYLKTYYRKYFNIAVMNNESTDVKGLPKINKTIKDCDDRAWMKQYNLNEISYTFELDDKGKIIPGVKILKGIGEKTIEDVVKNKPYATMADFLIKAKCNKTVLIALDEVGFFVNTFRHKLDRTMFDKKTKKKEKNKGGSLFE